MLLSFYPLLTLSLSLNRLRAAVPESAEQGVPDDREERDATGGAGQERGDQGGVAAGKARKNEGKTGEQNTRGKKVSKEKMGSEKRLDDGGRNVMTNKRLEGRKKLGEYEQRETAKWGRRLKVNRRNGMGKKGIGREKEPGEG